MTLLAFGINHATAHLTNPDMMVAQDVEVWSEIPKAVKSLGFAVTPTYPHLKCRYVRSVTYQNVIEALTAAKFKGLYIPYNGLNSSIGGFIDMPNFTLALSFLQECFAVYDQERTHSELSCDCLQS